MQIALMGYIGVGFKVWGLEGMEKTMEITIMVLLE